MVLINLLLTALRFRRTFLRHPADSHFGHFLQRDYFIGKINLVFGSVEFGGIFQEDFVEHIEQQLTNFIDLKFKNTIFRL